jgi:hypothetical protein
MVTFELWPDSSGNWFAQMIDPITTRRDNAVFTAKHRGEVIALVRLQIPLTHLAFREVTSQAFEEGDAC